MSYADSVLSINDDLPIKTDKKIHSGKVRAVYWLSATDSQRLIKQKGYAVPDDTPLAIMVISDRLSAFDCIWHAEGGLQGVPGKGAALNSISSHWFSLFKQHGLADSHILDIPHPLVWIVQKAQPIMIEAICRQYITGSMWRDYAKGERVFCGNALPDGLQKDQRLPDVLFTPSTKGILSGIPGVPEADDVNVARQTVNDYYDQFGFRQQDDVAHYESLLKQGFDLINDELAKVKQIFVDTKFEFGYVKDHDGNAKMIYMDEVGTPDSSRMWDADAYAQGRVVENSKEGFRQALLSYVPDADVLLNKERMDERETLAANTALPLDMLMSVSKTYTGMAEKITGKPLSLSDNPRQDIIDTLHTGYGLIR
ncbi:phosphoribosylaminoimidazolesuccinocarboxamide synthase [Aestuariibacter salexigens]|uniref:phosphoribosylaminoimidazolesuccinocarboxamide synthase n=1 Tax=Aestuariibacter salexigens TaxID=226010 RepID=UPI000408A66F|nr:phosphoribosylaminoimidazolesuccinocarboxamide synthase [Aestuariibacter salexigens]